MTLRGRLLLSLGGLLAVALLITGTTVVGVTRANLVAQLDAELRSINVRGQGMGAMRRGIDDPTGRRIAYLRLGRDGGILASIPSGFDGRPDPLPTLPRFPVEGPSALVGRIVQQPSTDDSISYRMLFDNARQGRVLVLAAPMQGVDDAIAALVRNLLMVGGLAVAALVAAGWFILRRGLRPLETIAASADRIATGDLAHRAGVPHDSTEAGRLGAAFDAMLDGIQSAFQRQEAALEAKERSEERLRRFVADASHELRTPITAVRGYADLYRAGGLDEPAELERAMARIGTESRRMGALVEDLLLLARLDQGRPLRREDVDLSTLVSDALDDARAVEPGRPITGDVQPGVVVAGDEDRLRQVVGNLLANVRVHAPPTAPAEVSLAMRHGLAEVAVVDHGSGVEPSRADRIFDRFYRADPGRSRDRGGSGLGLSIVRSVVDAHGGSVAHAPTPGGGATFTVRLPLRGTAPAHGASNSQQAHSRSPARAQPDPPG
jgi:two-component system, OmpR family, sensor kinase